MAADQLTTTRFDVMGCAARVVLVGDDGRLHAVAEQRLRDLEARWSRFLPDSEISRLNSRLTDTVSSDTVRLVEALVHAWHATDGAFDPTLLGALVGLGYGASRSDSTLHTGLPTSTSPRGDAGSILVDPAAGVVVLPHGTVIDPGGIGKGLAADIVAEEMIDAGADGVVIEIGGDLRVAGRAPFATWGIDVIPATAGQEPPRIGLLTGAVATSSSQLRTWSAADGTTHHHLLDPRTGRPTDGEVVSATVIAGTAMWAEAFAKCPFVNGADAALARWERDGMVGRILLADGSERTTPNWKDYV